MSTGGGASQNGDDVLGLDSPTDLAGFCRREYPRLVGALAYYTGDPYLAEELAQEALVKACRHWDRVVDFEAPGAWVHRVGINLANSRFRRRAVKRRVERELRPIGHHKAADPETSVALRQEVAALPADMKAVIVLRYFADQPVREVARHLGMPENTVKTLTRRAIERLRAAGFGPLGDSDD